jgi:hypothetical protein
MASPKERIARAGMTTDVVAAMAGGENLTGAQDYGPRSL